MIKVLHVIKWMGRGGAETWLMHVLRHIDHKKFSIDFMVQSNIPGEFDEEIRSYGSKILPCEGMPNIFVFIANFIKVIRKNGPYDIIHSHLHHFSGVVLLLARFMKIPFRIAHCHSNTASVKLSAHFIRRCYLKITEFLIMNNASLGLASSKLAAEDLYGPLWETNPKWKILHCGVDLKDFALSKRNPIIREEFGIPKGAKIIGHVGRFVKAKNHLFIIQVANELIRFNRDIFFLLIGDGDLLQEVKDFAKRYGISENMIFAGKRSDVPDLMNNAMDAFIFPSLYEGLGLAYIEAQAAGLPCIISDAIPEEADIIPSLIERLSLSQSPTEWARAVREAINKSNLQERVRALEYMRKSSFDIRENVKQLEDIYYAFRV